MFTSNSFVRRVILSISCLLLATAMIAPSGWAQQDSDTTGYPMGDVSQMGTGGITGANTFTGALGPTFIGDELYATLRLQPEFSIGKVGVGLDVPLMVSLEDGSFRSEPFEQGVGPLRVIRYVRYGRERRDPLYVKVGDLSGTTLGFGLIMYQYSNIGNYEQRDWGTEFNVNLDEKIGLEGVYSDFSQLSVVGLRPYVRPLQLAGLNLPFLKNFEIGALYVTDQSPTATPGGPAITIWGADAGLPISLGPIVQVVPFAAHARFNDPGPVAFRGGNRFEPGSGTSVGVNFSAQLLANLFSLSGKIERRFFGDNFTGSYFGPVYETNKLAFDDIPRIHPLRQLGRNDGQNGTFGSLYGHVLNSVKIGGSVQIPDQITRNAQGDVQQGAFLRLEARAPDLIPKITARAVYNRNPIGGLSDAIVLDENSNLNARIGYELTSFLLVGTNYRWTFARVTENGEETVEATSQIFPFVAVQFSF